MTTTVFFVRHGSHDRLDRVLCGRMAGVGLGEAGRAEAARLADRLAGERIGALYVSPLQRARETAEPIAERLGMVPVIAEALNEIDFGEWTGLPFDQLHDRPGWRCWNQARSHGRPPGGESMAQVQRRVADWLGAIVDRHPGAGVAAVCHADIIKIALCQALGLSLDHHDRLEVSPGSISVVAAGSWGLKVHAMNEAPR